MNREGWKRERKEARVDRPNRPWPNFFMIGLVTEQWVEIISEGALLSLKFKKLFRISTGWTVNDAIF